MNLEYIKTMMIVASSFGAEMDEPTIAFWSELFTEDGISTDQIKAAAKEIIRTRKYKSMPTYAEFIEFCEGTITDKARIQADEVIKQIRACGAYRTPIFNDPITAFLAEKSFTWGQICMLEEKNIPFFIKDFIEKYKTYSKDFKRKHAEQIECAPKVLKLTERIGK